MTGVNATELAQHLNVTKGRISHLVKDGRLAGCYQGEGRNRRFDLDAVAAALNKSLHPGQMMGNGAGTKAALREIIQSGADAERRQPSAPRAPNLGGAGGRGGGASALQPNDPDRYELARIDLAEQQARKARRDNEMAEGSLVLASEVERATARLLAQEVSQIEAVLKGAARVIADKMGVDYRTVRGHLITCWREHRTGREGALAEQADAAVMTDDEKAADI
jgi:hypothetical protein